MSKAQPASFPRPVRSVSLIIPCRNEAGTIEHCLQSILAQEDLAEDWEIIVADGLSDDGTREVLARLARTEPRLRVISNPQRIVSSGLNAAIRQARGEVIIRLDAHTEYAADYICQCLAALEESGADNVGGPWVAKGTGLMSRAIAAAFQSPFAIGGGRAHDPGYQGPADTVYLGCWRRSVFDRFGYFDETLVRNQDDEHNLRITRGGGQVWQSPRIRSWYAPRASLPALFRQYVQYGYWKVRVIQKHKLPASIRHLVPATFLLAVALGAVAALLSVLTPLPLAPARWLLLGLVGAYALGVAGAACLTAGRTEWKLLPVLPLVFPCYHIGYGWGFLRGILDFAVLRRGAGSSYVRLTRKAEAKTP